MNVQISTLLVYLSLGAKVNQVVGLQGVLLVTQERLNNVLFNVKITRIKSIYFYKLFFPS